MTVNGYENEFLFPREKNDFKMGISKNVGYKITNCNLRCIFMENCIKKYLITYEVNDIVV